jgi:hypothetical protein
VIIVIEQDVENAALPGAAILMHNPHLISVRAVHEKDFGPSRQYRSWKDSQQDLPAALRGAMHLTILSTTVRFFNPVSVPELERNSNDYL